MTPRNRPPSLRNPVPSPATARSIMFRRAQARATPLPPLSTFKTSSHSTSHRVPADTRQTQRRGDVRLFVFACSMAYARPFHRLSFRRTRQGRAFVHRMAALIQKKSHHR